LVRASISVSGTPDRVGQTRSAPKPMSPPLPASPAAIRPETLRVRASMRTTSPVPCSRTQIEPAPALRNRGPGGDSLAWAFGAIWLTDYEAGTVARYPAATLGVR
jgi:hypothetical protein